jgi:DNA-binding transcriptional ArsR family regulator
MWIFGERFNIRICPKNAIVKREFSMSAADRLKGLNFACECVSSRAGGYSDPWAGIAKNKLLPDGTKEEIVNLVAHEPKTISQMAQALNLSPPSVHTHVSEMLKSELLREAVEWEKTHQAERYYEPNFPVVKAEARAEFEQLCGKISERVADIFEKELPQLKRAFGKTELSEHGWEFSDMAQYLYACVQRGARQLLEERHALPPGEKHRNGVEWVFWAEEPGDRE